MVFPNSLPLIESKGVAAMFRAAAFIAALLPAIALADPLVSTTYGTDAGCQLFNAGGRYAVVTGGSGLPQDKIPSSDDILVVTPEELLAVEFSCESAEATIAADGRTVLVCALDDNPSVKPSVTILSEGPGSILSVTDEGGTYTLHPCETPLS